MKQLLFTLIVLTATSSFVFGQDRFNYSIQVGYTFANLNPQAYNFAIDSLYNKRNSDFNPQLSPVGWTSGFSGAIGFHRRRANFRLRAHQVRSGSFAQGTNNSGELIRRDIDLYNASIGLELSSALVEFARYMSFGVGAGLTMNYFETSSKEVPAATFSENDPLEVTSQSWDFGFKLHTPLQFKAPNYVGVAIEPYYLIFFSQTDFDGFNTALNGSGSTERRFLEEMDHFGVNVTLKFFILKE